MVDVFLTFKNFNGHPEVTTKMKSISITTLVIWGENDAWVPVAHIENWKRDVPQAKTIIYKNAGHIPIEEFPSITAADAERFLTA